MSTSAPLADADLTLTFEDSEDIDAHRQGHPSHEKEEFCVKSETLENRQQHSPSPFDLSSASGSSFKHDFDSRLLQPPTPGKLRTSDSSIDDHSSSELAIYRNTSSTTNDSLRDLDPSNDSDVDSIDSEHSATSTRSLPSSETHTTGGDSVSTISAHSTGSRTFLPRVQRPTIATTSYLLPFLQEDLERVTSVSAPRLSKFGAQEKEILLVESAVGLDSAQLSPRSSPRIIQFSPRAGADADSFLMAAAAGNNSHTSDSFSSLSSGIVKDSDHASSRITDAQDDEDSSSFLDRNRDTEHLITRDEIESPRAHDDIQLLRLIHIRSLPYWFHILMITFISLIGLGSYAAYDAVSAVQEELMKDLSLTPSQFGLLYSAYALPNVVLVIFGGTLVTRWGSHVVGLITTGLIAVGAIMVAWAPTMSLLSLKGRFTVMLIGRFIFGVGAESSYVVQNSMCVEWFFGDFLATAMAISAIGTRLGSIGSYALAPKIAVSSSSSPQGYTRALWVAAMTCVVSFLAVVGYTILRRYARSSLSSPRPSTSDVTYIELSEHLSNRTGMEDPQREDNLEYPDRPDSLPQAKPSTMRRLWNELKEVLIHIKNFSSLFWGCAVLGAFTYGIVLGFRAVVAEDMANRYKLSPEKSGLLMASIDITALFASPLIGWLVDWTLKMGWITLIGNSLSVASFLFFMPRISPYAGIILIGLSSATVPAAIYPAVSLLTSNSLEALAFGVMSSVINLSNLALNPLIGYSLQAGWFWMCLFLAFLSLMSVTVSLWWIIKDTKSENPVLDRPRDWSQEKHWISTNIPILSHTCS